MKFLVNAYVKFWLWSLKKWATVWEKILLHCIELKGLDPTVYPEQARRERFVRDLEWAVNHPGESPEDYYHFMYGRDQDMSDKTKQVIESYRNRWEKTRQPVDINWKLEFADTEAEIVEPQGGAEELQTPGTITTASLQEPMDLLAKRFPGLCKTEDEQGTQEVTEVNQDILNNLRNTISNIEKERSHTLETVEAMDIPSKKYKEQKAKNRNKNNKFKKVVHTKRTVKTKKQKKK